MRTVIFFGLMTIAESIGAQTGWIMSDRVIIWGSIVFVVAMIFDVLSFFHTMFKN